MYSTIILSSTLTLTLNPFPSMVMALKLPIPFPLFAPQFCPNSSPSPHSSPTQIRFSRWYNANAEKFELRRRSQDEIEFQIRRERRFESVTRISNLSESDASSASTNEAFRSLGTPSSPSNPSIPGRKSKYSKNPNPDSPPPFRRVSKTKRNMITLKDRPVGVEADVNISEDGVSYVIDGAPFEFKYSYTETPKVKPLKLREPYTPFGPTTIPRPWTGRAPLPPSKKKLPEFDSFRLPPKDKKGVKPVQAPGPFLPGTGPKYVMSREEILGEPLTQEEIKFLIQGCLKSSRQLNIGRDGLTHNMLDNIHSHWKRRRVCKIKCKGVCTVDMDNVKQQLEEKTGGKIIYSRGGTLYLYRGRNYNYRTRPRFPLMLWKPATPVYPRLIKQAPDGLTLEEATKMRKNGRKLIPICKLGKNGVYYQLVKHVKEAFEECELVRINCQGMNPSDFHKIGAKLKDLVPCVLISFESEHILIWRGRDWKSSLPPRVSISKEEEAPKIDEAAVPPFVEQQEASVEVEDASSKHFDSISLDSAIVATGENEELDAMKVEKYITTDASKKISQNDSIPKTKDSAEDDIEATEGEDGKMHIDANTYNEGFESRSTMSGSDIESGYSDIEDAEPMEQLKFDSISDFGNSETKVGLLSVSPATQDKLMYASEASQALQKSRVDEVLLLLNQAIENGRAVVLDDSTLDADIVYRRAVTFSQSAPPGPVFRHYPRKVRVDKSEEPRTVPVDKREKPETWELEIQEVTAVSVNEGSEKKVSKTKGNKIFGEYNLNAPQGSLGVDELAKLLA